jgi:hypothetical protein
VNKDEQKKLVGKLIEWIEGYEFIKKDLYLSIGYSGETILGDSVSKLFELSVEAVANAIGDSDEWLWWFILENDCGKKQLSAGYKTVLKNICTVDDLFWLIELGINGVEVSA